MTNDLTQAITTLKKVYEMLELWQQAKKEKIYWEDWRKAWGEAPRDSQEEIRERWNDWADAQQTMERLEEELKEYLSKEKNMTNTIGEEKSQEYIEPNYLTHYIRLLETKDKYIQTQKTFLKATEDYKKAQEDYKKAQEDHEKAQEDHEKAQEDHEKAQEDHEKREQYRNSNKRCDDD